MTPEGEDYVNPSFQIMYADPEVDDGPDWSEWKDGASEGNRHGSDEAQVEQELEETDGNGGEQPGLLLVTRPDEDQGEKGGA